MEIEYKSFPDPDVEDWKAVTKTTSQFRVFHIDNLLLQVTTSQLKWHQSKKNSMLWRLDPAF